MSEEAPIDTFAEGTVKREVLIDVKTKETWLADVAKNISSTMFLVHPMKNDVPKVCVEEPLRREALSNVQMLGVPLTIPYNVRRAYAMAYAEDEKGLPTLLLLTGYDSTEGTAVEWTTSKMWHFHRPASLALLSLVRHANVNGNEEAYPRTLKLISGWIAAKSKGKQFAHTPANRERLGQAMNNVRLLYLTKETDYKDRGVVQSRGEDWELVKQAAREVESEHWAPKAAKKLELNGAGKKNGAGAGASTSTSKKVESDSDSDDSDMSKPLSKSLAAKVAAAKPAATKPAATKAGAAKPAATKPGAAKAAAAKPAAAKPKTAVENGKGGMGGKLAKMKAAGPAPPPPPAPSLVVDGADHKKPLTKKKLAIEAMEEEEEDALALRENEADGMFPDHDEVDYEDDSDVESDDEDARMAAEYEMSVRDAKKKKKETELRNVGSEDNGEEAEEGEEDEEDEEEDEEAKSNMETGDEEEESESEESESEESETAEEKTEESGSASESSDDVDSGESSRVVNKKSVVRKKAIASDGEDMDVECGLLTEVPVDNMKSALKGSKRKRKAIEESEDEDEHFDEDGDDDGGEGGTTAATKRIRSNPTKERQAIDVVGKAAIAAVKGSEETEQMKQEAMQVLEMYVKTGKRMEEYQLIKTIFGLLHTLTEDKSEGRSLSEEVSFMEARMVVNKKIMKMQEESMMAVAAVAKSVAAASAAADNAMQAMNVTALGVATSVEAMKVDAEA